MFNFSANLLAGQHDLRKERPPPSRPVPVTFPSLQPPEPSASEVPDGWTQAPLSSIPAHFLSLKKPSDVTLETLKLLNITFHPTSDIDQLLSPEASLYLPPKSWLEAPVQSQSDPPPTAQPSVQLLSNNRRAPDRNEFYTRAKELLFKNEDAFAALSRKASPGQAPLRLAHFRKFWEGLDNMAYYWDNSMDEYMEPKAGLDTPALEKTAPNGGPMELVPPELDTDHGPEMSSALLSEPRKKPKTNESPHQNILSHPANSMSLGLNASAIQSSKLLPARSAPPRVPWALNMPIAAEKPVDLSKGSYRGYRIGNAAEMPDQYRLDCTKAFLEPIAWAFGVTLVPHRRPPVLSLEHIRFPVRMNCVAWRGPTDRMKARQGWLEGPVIGLQCRPETSFGGSGNLEADSVLDAMREIGGLLLLAQERAREGAAEVKSGEGKWWTSTPRWGGGPGGEIGEAVLAASLQEPTSAPPAPPQSGDQEKEHHAAGRSRAASTKDRRRPTPAEIWKTLRPGNSLWDAKTVYEAIGKDAASDWDEIYMVSSLNTHISILKLRVHRAYIEYLTYGRMPKTPPADADWSSPKLQRSKWYDLFDVNDRTEAMRVAWAVFAYLMRAPEKEQVETQST